MTQETKAAIAACVGSVEELEVLLLLSRSRARYWSPAMVSGDIGRPKRVAAAALEALAARNLLDVRIAGAVLYRFDPASAEARACVERTLHAAAQDRASVVKAILAASSAGPAFADAFRATRKRRSDG